jgi:4-amino-4-deoxy-L-arabinose transferase-like glycosyltransferase
VDDDEGFYLHASSEVKHGKYLYSDFFFQQMPLLPYLLTPFVDHGFLSLLLCRSIYGLASIFLGILIFRYCLKRSADFQTSIGAYLLYILNGFMLSWHTVIQFNALTDMLTFSSFLLFIRSMDEDGKSIFSPLLGAGILLGFVIALRIVFFPLLILFILALILFQNDRRYFIVLKKMILFLGGFFMIFSIPLVFLWKHGSLMLFNVIGFHLIRNRLYSEDYLQFSNAFYQKMTVLFKFFFFPQTGLLLLLSILAFLYYKNSYRKHREKLIFFRREILLLSMAFLIFVSYLYATPSIFHYFVQIIPFLIPFSVLYLQFSFRDPSRKKILLLGGLLYIISLPVPLYIHLKGPRDRDQIWQMSTVNKVIQEINHLTFKEDKILSFWPGYYVFTGRERACDLNPWEITYSRAMTEAQRIRYRILDIEKMKMCIRNGKAALIVSPFDSQEEEEWNILEAYDKVKEIAGISVYIPKSKGI